MTEASRGVRSTSSAAPVASITNDAPDSFTLDSHTIILVVVQDTVAPVIQVTVADPEILWPPNHEMVPVTLAVFVSDDCQQAQHLTLTAAVSSSEPDDTAGDGATTTGTACIAVPKSQGKSKAAKRR